MSKIQDMFVVGAPRSGGTLLYNIICSDPTVNPALRENHFVAITLQNYSFMKSRVDMEYGHFFTLDMTKQFYTNWIQSFLNIIHSKYSQTPRIAIKSIDLAPCIPLLYELLPEIRYCMSVRDPRDIVASMIAVGLKQQQQGIRPQYPRNAQALAIQVMNHYMPSLNNRSDEFQQTITWVKYESLVEDTATIILQLEKRLDLDLSKYDPRQSWPRNEVDIERLKSQGDPFITDLWGKKISDASIGKYKAVLSQHEIATVEKICSPIMKLFNYEICKGK